MLKKTIIFAVLVFLSLGFCFGVAADEDADKDQQANAETMFTEEVEVLGNVPVAKTIQSVSVFKMKEFEKFNFESLKSVLKLTPGLLTLSNGQFGQSSSTYIRGSKTTQILYVVDGIKLRDGASVGGVNLAVLSPNLLERVEVVRGPLSSLYGSDAMGGVISVSTNSREGADFLASIGSHGSYTGSFAGATQLDNVKLGMSVSTQKYSNDVVNDEFKNTGLTAKVNYNTDLFDVGLRFFGSFTDSGIPLNGGVSTPERAFKKNYSILALPFVYRFGENTSLDVKLAYTNSNYEFTDPQDTWDPYFKSRFVNYEAEATYSTRIMENLDFRAGVDYSDQKILNENDNEKTLDDEKMSYFSSYVSSAFNLDALQITASLRFDKYKDIDANYSPQVGISYLVANKFKLRAAYSHSFLAPMVSQIVNPWGLPNMELKPEKGKSFEVGAEYYSAPVTLSAAYFNTRYEDMIDWITVDYVTFSGQYQNIKNVDTHGYELAATVRPIDSLSLSGAYTYLHTEDKATGLPLIRKPKHTFSGFVAYAHKLFSLSASFVYVGKRQDNDYSAYPTDVENPAYNTFDFSVMVPVYSGLTVFGKMTNAFDEQYQEIAGYPSPGRRFELGLKYRIH
jgi:vitamin B12 transporter